MARKDWLRLVAAHSDAWLYSVAFYYGAKLRAPERSGLSPLKLWVLWCCRVGSPQERSAVSTAQLMGTLQLLHQSPLTVFLGTACALLQSD